MLENIFKCLWLINQIPKLYQIKRVMKFCQSHNLTTKISRNIKDEISIHLANYLTKRERNPYSPCKERKKYNSLTQKIKKFQFTPKKYPKTHKAWWCHPISPISFMPNLRKEEAKIRALLSYVIILSIIKYGDIRRPIWYVQIQSFTPYLSYLNPSQQRLKEITISMSRFILLPKWQESTQSYTTRIVNFNFKIHGS